MFFCRNISSEQRDLTTFLMRRDILLESLFCVLGQYQRFAEKYSLCSWLLLGGCNALHEVASLHRQFIDCGKVAGAVACLRGSGQCAADVTFC